MSDSCIRAYLSLLSFDNISNSRFVTFCKIDHSFISVIKTCFRYVYLYSDRSKDAALILCRQKYERCYFFDAYYITKDYLKKSSRSSKTDHSTDHLQIMMRLDEILQSFNRRSIDLQMICQSISFRKMSPESKLFHLEYIHS